MFKTIIKATLGGLAAVLLFALVAPAAHGTTAPVQRRVIVYRVSAAYCLAARMPGSTFLEFLSLARASRAELDFVHQQDANPHTIRRVDLMRAHVVAPIQQHVVSKSVRDCH